MDIVTELFRLIFTLASGLMIIGGILSLNTNFYIKMVKFTNSMNGIKTKVDDTTKAVGKIQGVAAIIFGAIFLYSSIKFW